jgi:hypothetical protein
MATIESVNQQIDTQRVKLEGLVGPANAVVIIA